METLKTSKWKKNSQTNKQTKKCAVNLLSAGLIQENRNSTLSERKQSESVLQHPLAFADENNPQY